MKEFRKSIVTGIIATMLMTVAAAGFCATTIDITGTVEQKGDIIVLFTPDDTYVLKGSEMLPGMIGEKVTVTGTIEVKDHVKVVTVEDFEAVKK